IAAVGEDVAQPRVQAPYRSKHRRRAVAILHFSPVDDSAEQIALRIDEDVTLAPLDFLTGVEAPRAARLSGFDRLAVDRPGARRRLTPNLFPQRHDQNVIDARHQAAARPSVKIALNSGIRRKILGQLPPLAAGGGDVEDRLDNGAQRRNARPAAPKGAWQERFDQRPFFVRSVTPILAAGDFSPSHKIPSNLANPKES